jgi:hypothetical protein
LLAAGCYAGDSNRAAPRVYADFHREASTLEEAINSAIANVTLAGFEVGRVEIEAGAIPQSA